MQVTNDGEAVLGCCGIMILNLILGAVSINYCLWAISGKSVPLIAAIIAGLFLGQFTVPLMIVCWLIRLAGVPTPFLGH